MFTRIPRNLLEDSGKCYYFNIPGNVRKYSRNVRRDFGECSRRFREMFEEIAENVQDDSGECSRGFRGMFKKIPGEAQEDFGESKFRFIL